LGILAKLVATPSVFEPYRNAVTIKEIKDCLLKLLEITAQVQREATRNNSSLIRPLAKVFLYYNKVLFFSKIILIKWQQFLDFSA
jgi:hypothetical protein